MTLLQVSCRALFQTMGVGGPAKEPVQPFPCSDNGGSFPRRTTRKGEAEQQACLELGSW